MNIIFNSTKKKIALSFALFAGSLLIGITLITIFLIRIETERQAQKTLEQALKTVIIDFNTQNIKEKTTRNISRNSVSYDSTGNSESLQYEKLPNVLDKKIVEQKHIEKDEIADIDLNQLKENRTVYSRVISSNGDILFSSDLFDQLNVDTSQEGFFTFNFENICIHTYTAKINSGENMGSTVQVGQYCPFSYNQQRTIFLQMIGITMLFLLFTYFLGLKIAGKFLKPMQKAAQQTREFAENCYHELLTPLTVAMTTIDATKQSKTYEKGIQSLDEDLKNMYYSLQTLNKNAVENNQHTIEDSTNISQLIEKLISKFKPLSEEKSCKIIAHISPKIYKNIDPTSAKIIFQNIFMNAVKYAEEHTKIEINVDQKTFFVKNYIQNPQDIDIKQLFHRGYRGENVKEIEGNGFGLAIVKDLCETYGWKIDVELKNNEVHIEIEMK